MCIGERGDGTENGERTGSEVKAPQGPLVNDDWMQLCKHPNLIHVIYPSNGTAGTVMRYMTLISEVHIWSLCITKYCIFFGEYRALYCVIRIQREQLTPCCIV
jgi:hypothetical protein